MQHLKFRILAGFLACLVIVFAGLYTNFTINHSTIDIRLGLKISPILSCILFIILYIFYYRLTIYSVFVLGSLFLCMFGDIFLGLYDPNIEDIVNNKMIYFILGGSFFMVARILLIVTFMIKPFSRISLIRHNKVNLMVSHIVFTFPFLCFAIFNCVRDPGFISFSTFVYLTFTFGLPQSYAYLRVDSLNNIEVTESVYSCYIAFIGITLFNISDILLIISMFTNWLPPNSALLSDNIYWIAIYLITISIIRTSDENLEKGIYTI
jgi:hypothetical protein